MFELLPEVKLNHAVFKVTSFVDFSTYLQAITENWSFLQMINAKLQLLIVNSKPKHSDEEVNFKARQALYELLTSFYMETQFLLGFLSDTESEFLAVIDHLKLHPSAKSNSTTTSLQTKRSVFGGLKEIFCSLLGFGNSQSYDQDTINMIKSNLKILQMDINDQQGEIQKNMALINLTRVDVGYNHDMLHTLDMKLVAFNQTFTANIRSLQNITSGLISIAATQHYLSMFQTSFAQIQQDVDAVYEYLTTVSTHKVTPTLIPPQEL